MRTIHYSIRLILVLAIVSLIYLSATSLFHQAVQIPVVLTLLFITLCTERLWRLLAWLSPVMGAVDTKEQERVIEYELTRSQRYNSPLVVAAIREEKRTSLNMVAQNLRTTDIVLRSSAGHLLILLPGITLEQATQPLKRLAMILPIKGVVVADEKMLQIMVKTQRANSKDEVGNISPAEFRKICIQALEARWASIKSSTNETDEAAIYTLLDLPEVQTVSDRKIRS